MKPSRPEPSTPAPPSLHHRAADDLRFIRATMERAGSFTAVPGRGTVAVGLIGLLAAAVAARQPDAARWLLVWLIGAALAGATGIVWMSRKARAQKIPLLRGSGARFLLGLCPPFLAAAILTPILYRSDMVEALPGLWLLLYGTGITTGGAFSIRLVPAMGLCFMALGTAALFLPSVDGDLFMAIGFGGLSIVFGAVIAWRYGG